MRRGSVLKGAVEAAEAFLDVLTRQPNLLERGDHRLGFLITNGAGGDLIPIANCVILVCLDGKRILSIPRLAAALWHRERVVR